MHGCARSIWGAVQPLAVVMLEVAGINTFYGRAHILHGLSLDVGYE